MRKNILAVFALSAMLYSCENSVSTGGSKNNGEVGSEVNNSPGQGNVTIIDSIAESTKSTLLGKRAISSKSAEELASSGSIIPMKIVANIAVPVVDGVEVQATCVAYDAATQLAYIAYNTQDDANAQNDAVYKGGVDVVSMVDPKNPRMVSSVTTRGYEFSSIAIDAENGYLFAVGAADMDVVTINNQELISSAILVRYALNADGTVSSAEPTCVSLSGYVAKDVKVLNSKVLVVSGDNGSASVYDANTLAPGASRELVDARSFAVVNNSAFILSGANTDKAGYVYQYDNGGFQELISGVSMDNANYAGAQRIMDSYGNYLLIPQGEYGLSVYPIAGGSSVNDVPVNTDQSGEVTTDVALNTVRSLTYKNKDYLLLSEGAMGLNIRTISGGDITKPMGDNGVVNLAGSTNYAYVGENADGGDFVFVATGKGGVNILQLFGEDNGGDNASFCDTEYANAVYEDYDLWDNNQRLAVQNGTTSDVFYLYSASGNMNFGTNINSTVIWSGNFSLNGNQLNSGGVLVVCGGTFYTNTVSTNGQIIVDGDVDASGNLITNSLAGLTVYGNNRTIKVSQELVVNSGSNLVIEGNDVKIKVSTLNMRGNLTVKGDRCDIEVAGFFGSDGGRITFEGADNTINVGSEGNANTVITGDYSGNLIKDYN